MVGPGWTSYDTVIILVTVLVPASMIAMWYAMFRGLKRRHLLQRGLVHIVFLPEKQRRFLVALALLGAFFVGSGIVEAIAGVGLIDTELATVLSSATFIGGAISLFLLIWTALRPGDLTEDQKAQLAWLPQQYYPMVLGPFETRESR
jgi:hypothetical protein